MYELVRLIKYINYTKDYHLTIGSAKPITLFGMSDAAYIQAGDCKSNLGYAIYLSNDSGAVYSRCKRASTVSLSSTQAEVEALVELTKEIIWYQGFLTSIGIQVKPPTEVFVDNMPTVTLADEGNHLKRSKHYVVKTTFIKDLVEYGTVSVKHLPRTENHSDLLTKTLSGASLKYHTYGILGYQNKQNKEWLSLPLCLKRV
jgi:hypothetical protein